MLWDEETSGVPGPMLHVAAVQWLWDTVVTWPTKDHSNILLVQYDEPALGGNLCGWMSQAPNIILAYTGHKTIEEVRQMSEMAYKQPPPLKLDQAMVRQLSEAANNFKPFWEVLAEPKVQEQEMQRRRILQTEAVRLFRQQRREELERQRRGRAHPSPGRQPPKKRQRRASGGPGTGAALEQEEHSEPELVPMEPEHVLPVSQQLEVDVQEFEQNVANLDADALGDAVENMLRAEPVAEMFGARSAPPHPLEAPPAAEPRAPKSKPQPRRKISPPVPRTFQPIPAPAPAVPAVEPPAPAAQGDPVPQPVANPPAMDEPRGAMETLDAALRLQE